MRMISNQIKRIREQNGYSQERLAELAGVSLRTVQRVENGETEPRGDTINRLCNALDISPEKVMDWRKEKDTTYLSLLNLSALSFILFPLLGILIPLILWITKKEKIQNVQEVGKDLLNFQITWTIFLFIGFVGYQIWYASFINNLGDISPSIIAQSIRPIQWIAGILYLYNLLIIIANTLLVSKNKPVWYYPRINFIR